MADDRVLDRRPSAWIQGRATVKMGSSVLTTDRVLFFGERLASGVGGVIGTAAAAWMSKQSDRPPLFDLPLADITRVERSTTLLTRNRIRLVTAGGDYLLADLWKRWSPLLRETLKGELGRTVVEESPYAWRIEASPAL